MVDDDAKSEVVDDDAKSEVADDDAKSEVADDDAKSEEDSSLFLVWNPRNKIFMPTERDFLYTLRVAQEYNTLFQAQLARHRLQDVTDPQRDILVQINSVSEEVDKLREKISDNSDNADRDVIGAELYAISQKLDNVKEQGESLTAPVKIPPLEDMTIELVPSHSLERLDEYRSDLNWLYSLLGLFGGGVISVVVGWVSPGTFSWASASLLLLLVIVTVLLGLAVWRTQSRSLRVRETMRSSKLGLEEDPVPSKKK